MRLGKASDMSSASKKAEKYENINKIQGRMSEKNVEKSVTSDKERDRVIKYGIFS